MGKRILAGLLVAGVGIAITLGTYGAAASSGGGSYVVAWGAILIGGWQVIRGLLESPEPRNPHYDALMEWRRNQER